MGFNGGFVLHYMKLFYMFNYVAFFFFLIMCYKVIMLFWSVLKPISFIIVMILSLTCLDGQKFKPFDVGPSRNYILGIIHS